MTRTHPAKGTRMDKRTLTEDHTLILMNLTAWNPNGQKKPAASGDMMQSWKGYDFDVLDALEEDGFISTTHRSKSAYITKTGQAKAAELVRQYGISIDPTPDPQPFFRLMLRFCFDELSCTRTVLVPEHTTFEDFHTMIQACMNWLNYHLYRFSFTENDVKHRISWPNYETGGDPDLEWALPSDDLGVWNDADKTFLDDVFPGTKCLMYEYDYGDNWHIEITLTNHGEKFASEVPFCVDGVGDAPPEDVGGEWGFSEFLHILEAPDHPEHQYMAEWGEGQGFERFSKNRANRRMARWQDWKRIEEPSRSNPQVSNVIKVDFGQDAATISNDATDKDDAYEQFTLTNLANNARYLQLFHTFLSGLGISGKTIHNHLSNAEFFLNEYLCHYEAATMEQGIQLVGVFLGDWFIRKCMWSSATSIKQNATSLKKFYKCMAANGLVAWQDYKELCGEIKQDMPDWLDFLKQWEDPDSDYWTNEDFADNW